MFSSVPETSTRDLLDGGAIFREIRDRPEIMFSASPADIAPAGREPRVSPLLNMGDSFVQKRFHAVSENGIILGQRHGQVAGAENGEMWKCTLSGTTAGIVI